MRRVLVTGGAGFIGKHLVDALRRQGDLVLIVDDLSNSRRAIEQGGEVFFCELSILDAKLDSIFMSFSPDVVFHLAARISVTDSIASPSADALCNIQGTVRLLELARAANTKRFVLVSSGGALYGECPKQAASEETAIAPQSPYGLSKLSAERYLDWFEKTTDMSGVCLRLANVYGPGQGEEGEGGVIPIFVKRMLAGKDITIYGDGSQSRDFIYVDCVVDALIRASRASDVSGCINVSSGQSSDILQLVTTLVELTGYSGEVIRKERREGEIRHSRLDWTKARDLLGWRPRVSLVQGLELVVKACRPPPAYRATRMLRKEEGSKAAL